MAARKARFPEKLPGNHRTMDGRMPDAAPDAADRAHGTTGRLLLLRATLPLARIAAPSPFGAMDEAYIRRYASFDVQNERRVARALLLHGLRLLGVDDRDLRFQSMAHGKPALPQVRFSFSYADVPCCLVSREPQALGLDCLQLREDFLPAPGFFKDGWRLEKCMHAAAMQKRSLPPGKNRDDRAAVHNLKTRGLLRRLTMVEAIGKAQGTAMAHVRCIELGETFRRMGVCTLRGERFAWRTLAFAGSCMTMAVDEAHADLLRKVEVIPLHRQDFA